jgi:hypothetical protein
VYVTGLDPRWPFKYGRIPWIDDLDGYRALPPLRHRRRADQSVTVSRSAAPT